MAAFFRPRANLFARLAVAAVVGIVLIVSLVAYGWNESSYNSGQDLFVDQPVPFSHQHHVGSLGIDCRYCHTSVESSSFAGMPPTQTCMNCHQQIWTEAEILKPIRDSWHEDKPIHWNRVHNLPEFVYFNHAIHVNKGVGCVECHGRVDTMPLMYQENTLFMQWCLDCHRNPGPHLRPKDVSVTNMTWQPDSSTDKVSLQATLMNEYHIDTKILTDCGTCHR